MVIYVNGEERQLYDTVSELLKNDGYRLDRIAVEVNGKIIKKADYDLFKINDGDKIEIVSFVGGG